VPALDRSTYRPYGYVAHALGSVDGRPYTNSREAFENSYQAGFRTFEVDLIRLRDGSVIAAHNHTEKWLGLNKSYDEVTLADVRGRKWFGKYTVLTGDDLVALMRTYRDIYFVLDTKWAHVEIVRGMLRRTQDPQVQRRMLPHIAGQEDLDAIRRYYPLQHYVVALYRTQWAGKFDDREVLSFVRRNHAPSVMMWVNERDPRKSLQANNSEGRRYTAAFSDSLVAAGAVTFVHSLTDTNRMRDFEAKGVGVYSNASFGPPLVPQT
jgi:glycerophosphoryl diester phosphodiesterase